MFAQRVAAAGLSLDQADISARARPETPQGNSLFPAQAPPFPQSGLSPLRAPDFTSRAGRVLPRADGGISDGSLIGQTSVSPRPRTLGERFSSTADRNSRETLLQSASRFALQQPDQTFTDPATGETFTYRSLGSQLSADERRSRDLYDQQVRGDEWYRAPGGFPGRVAAGGLADELRNDPSVMAQLPVMPEESEPGAPTVPLSSVARFEAAEGPNQISRENGKRRIIVHANVRGRDLGGFVAEARREVAANVQPPTGGWFDGGGQFENLERASTRLALIVPLVFLTIGALLVLALRSFRDAALVFAGVPLALVGGALALASRGMPLSISAAVGFIAVSGVATLNGLVLMQAIQQRLAEGDPPVQAALTGAVSRLRAVLTTALVAVLGFIPMAFAWGPGAEVQKPLATVVIGGLTTATLLTLLVLPVLASLPLLRSSPPSRG